MFGETFARTIIDRMRTGPQTVLWTPPHVGFGNHLYLWQRTAIEQCKGNPWKVLMDTGMSWWIPYFPKYSDFVINRSQVGLRDRREFDMQQTYGSEYSPAENRWFCREMILPSLKPVTYSDDTVVINVRRGDYYSNPRFRGSYSFDIPEYVRCALFVARQMSAVDKVVIVSDDPEWCRLKLPNALLEVDEVTILPSPDPIGHLQTLAGAKRLILANSTFSYWGAYISNAYHGDNHTTVIAPRFHCRTICSGLAWQLDPRWTIIDSIPAGWDG